MSAEPADRPLSIVVVVEDNPDVAYLIGMQLTETAEVAAVLHDVPAALAYDGWGRCDLAVVDWRLPGGSGADILEYLRVNYPGVRRLLTSGGDPPQWVRDLAGGYWPKADLAALAPTVAEMF